MGVKDTQLLIQCHRRQIFAWPSEISVAVLQHPRRTFGLEAEPAARNGGCLDVSSPAQYTVGWQFPLSSRRNPALHAPRARTMKKCRATATVNMRYLALAEPVTGRKVAPTGPDTDNACKFRPVHQIPGRREVFRPASITAQSRLAPLRAAQRRYGPQVKHLAAIAND